MTRIEELLRDLAEPVLPLDDPAGRPALPPVARAEAALARARTRRRRRLLSAAGGAAATVVAAGLVAAALPGPGQRADGPAAQHQAGPLGARATLLLLGSDAGADRTGVLVDSVVLASIDTGTGATALVSLPRNLAHVPFPPGTPQARAHPRGYACADANGQQCLLGTLWEFGAAHPDWYPGTNPGLAAVQEGVEQATGQHVDAAVVLDLRGFARLVDAVGGVTVDVRRPLPIGGHVDAAGRQQGVTAYIPAGRRHLDGYQALWFARSRSDSSDADRMLRQRCLLGALGRQIDWASLATNFPRIAATIRQDLATTIPADRFGDWAVLAATAARLGHVTSLVVDRGVVDPARPDYPYLRQVVRHAITPESGERPSAAAKGAATPHTVDVRGAC